jgi:hypothetical protein
MDRIEVGGTPPEQDAIREGGDDIPLHKRAYSGKADARTRTQCHTGDQGRCPLRLLRGVVDMPSPPEALGEVYTEVFVFCGEGDYEPT